MRLPSFLRFGRAILGLGLLAASQVFAAAPPLPAMGTDAKENTVSGLSSGGFMATQFSVANSALIAGTGVIAGGPFYCAGLGPQNGAERFMVTATTLCMQPLGPAPSGTDAWKAAQKFAAEKLIDPVDNIKHQRLYIFTGSADTIVRSKVVAQTLAFYRHAGVPDNQIRYVDNINAGHAFITDNRGDLPCTANAAPNINNCGFVQAHDILQQLYGPLKPPAKHLSGQVVQFDQTEFSKGMYDGLSDIGYAYIPAVCGKESCRVHVVFHGCTQEANRMGNRVYTTLGYNEIADSNRIVVLYPQIRTDPRRNPMGCWDFWGYSSKDPYKPNFYTKDAPQISAIRSMVERLNSPRQ